jgi:hypothetical protein
MLGEATNVWYELLVAVLATAWIVWVTRRVNKR